MKKIFLMLVAALMVGTATVNAQIGGGQLILRGGFAANNFKGDHSSGCEMLPGYNVGLDFNKDFWKDAYWNVGVMFGTRGYDTDWKADYRAHNINIPFTVGYKYNLTDNLAIDGRFGGFLGVDMAGKFTYGDKDVNVGDVDDYKRFDGGLVIGVGIWYKRINLDYMFKRGFGEIVDGSTSGSVNHLLRIGYAF